MSLLGAISNANFLEYMPWFSPLYCEQIEFRDGDAVLPERPGWGFTFDMERIAHLEAGTA